MNLYQDAAGTIPAVLAGQPVGFAKRKSGTVDAIQATALSKATLGRWPKTGRRNICATTEVLISELGGATNAWAVSGAAGRAAANPWNGFRGMDVVGNGLDWHRAQSGAAGPISGLAGEKFTVTMYIGRGSSERMRSVFRNESAANESNISFNLTTGVVTKTQGSGLVTNESVTDLGGGIYRFIHTVTLGTDGVIKCGAGPGSANVGDYITVYAAQFERGATATPMQNVYGPNDITESGISDMWHLYNDGGDSLNVNLPAGTYGILSMDINKAIKTESVVLAAQGDINILRNERQLDSIIRTGAFSPVEQREIEDYWKRKYQ